MRLVVFGWGNEARGDDALGPLLLRRIAAMRAPDVETIEDYQLQIEHALDLNGFDAALFVDADRAAPAPFAFREIHAGAAPPRLRPMRCRLKPCFRCLPRSRAGAPPPAFVLGMRGERFGLGEGLSAAGAAALAAAADLCERLLASRSLSDWRLLAREAAGRPCSLMSSGL